MSGNATIPDFSEGELGIVPLERAQTIPSSWYTDPRFLEIEKKYLFNEMWQYVGHLSRAPNPGDYFVAELIGNPVIVVRGNDNVLRAFFNVCRHRGGPLAMQDGHGKVLQCKYHGWTYALEGHLRGVPRFDRTELFDKKDYGLIPLTLATSDGLVFVALGKGSHPLSSILRGIAERIAPIDLSSMKFYRQVNYKIACNWKVYVDNYLEGYHVPFVHPELAKVLDYQQYATETFEHYSLQHSPLAEEDNVYGVGKGHAFYYLIFPNFMLNILPGRLQTNFALPLSHRETLVIFDYYYDDISSDAAMKRIEEDMRYSDFVQQEDIAICERVQKGLESVAYDRGRFSVEMERAVYHFQCFLKRQLRQAFQV